MRKRAKSVPPRLGRHHVLRQFNGPGLAKVTHWHGTSEKVDLSITSWFKDGHKIDEMYAYNERRITRRKYERERTRYAGMPSAETSFEDRAENARPKAREARRRHANAAKRHVPDGKSARQSDKFCTEMMSKGRCMNALVWIQSKGHTLGEMTWAPSRRLVEKLRDLGAVAIKACQIDSYEKGFENTGHLILKLPTETVTRAALFEEMD